MDQATDLAIQGTNTSSIASKRSLERLGYLDRSHVPGVTEPDSPFLLKYVVPKPIRRSPVINRAYFQRTESIRILIDGWIEECESLGLEECAIINIGCGFDPTYFRLKTLRKDKQDRTKLKYIDIDYPTLIVERLYTVRNQDTLFNLLPEDPSKDDVGEFVSDTYSCLGIDLRKLDQLQKGLEQAGVSKSASKRMPILVISEVVLAYMEANESDAVIKFFAEYPEATFILHEQCIPSFDANDEEKLHPFASTMFRHFERTMTPLKTLREYQSLQDHRNRFQELGWVDCDIMNMNLFTDLVVMPTERDHQRICGLEPFDEYDEQYWIGSYYFIAVATTEPKEDSPFPARSPDVIRHIGLRTKLQDLGILSEFHADETCYTRIDKSTTTQAPTPRIPSLEVRWTVQNPFPGLDINRKGHTISILGDNAYIFGGFGLDAVDHQEDQKVFQTRGQQTRLGSTLRLHLTDGSVETLLYDEGPAPRMHHSVATSFDGSTIYLYGGRDGPTKVHNDLWCFTAQNGWDPLWRGRVIHEGDSSVPKGLFKHTANMVTIAGREMMVVFGGRLESGEANNQVWAFDLEDCLWEQFSWRQPGSEAFKGIFSHSSVVIRGQQGQDDSLIVIGGVRGRDEKVLEKVWRITFRIQQDDDMPPLCWADAEEIHVEALSSGESLKPRFGHASVLVGDNRIWILGGVSAPGLLQWEETMIEVQLDTGKFQHLQPSSFKELVMVGHAAVVDQERNRVIGVGGGGTCFGFGAWWDASSWAVQL
ncbi:S-adenosyl-L-methionine-dependent methyltransferase [Mortierella sp. GBAus27b]|nr:Leucine carboxyl methyltransferase 2 [Mortierella sp. GBA43]KAI8348795.1 S-adenosyl-L-methionine-dependent methyltransferase [Mortierella sp. GBAus27b]